MIASFSAGPRAVEYLVCRMSTSRPAIQFLIAMNRLVYPQSLCFRFAQFIQTSQQFTSEVGTGLRSKSKGLRFQFVEAHMRDFESQT